MRQLIKKGSFKLFIIFLLMFFMVFSQIIVTYAASDNQNTIDAVYLQNIINMIFEKYNGQITVDQLMQGALKGLFDTMDPYTAFFTPEEADSFLGTIEGTFTGIGISMEPSGDYIMISKVFPGSPAEKSGIIQGDRIIEVDGKNMIGATLEEAVSLIKGEAGTKVKLGIIRNGRTGSLILEITRAVISINPVTYDIVNGIGYLRLDMFSSNTGAYLAQALNEMDKKQITKIILDLRGNPGGEVVQAVEAARNFVPEGVITKLDFKSDQFTDITYESNLKAPKYKLAVLVNGMSASASEIVAGAIQDTRAGTLIGTKTFGKAKVQGLIPVLTPEASARYEQQLGINVVDASELSLLYGIVPEDNEIIGYSKMTIGFYYTPAGRMIDGTGIIPDIAVEDARPVLGIDLAGIQKLTRTYKPGLNDGGTDVLNAEKILKILGYDVDTPDSFLDGKAFRAVKKFQKDVKLFPYGVIDFNTQKALNDALDSIIMKYDKQYAKAVELLNK